MDTNLRARIFGMAAAALGVAACGGAPTPEASAPPPAPPAPATPAPATPAPAAAPGDPAVPGAVEVSPGDAKSSDGHEVSCAPNGSCGAKVGAASCGAKQSGEKPAGLTEASPGPSGTEAAEANPAAKPAKPAAKPAKRRAKKPAETTCGAGSCNSKK